MKMSANLVPREGSLSGLQMCMLLIFVLLHGGRGRRRERRRETEMEGEI
jgi:hypothetical protein